MHRPIFADVEPRSITETLNAAEAAVDAGRGVAGTGFWSVVASVKQHPELADEYADRIAGIDEKAFRNWHPLLTIPIGIGTTLAVVAVLAGLALIGLAYGMDGTTAVIVFYAGVVALLASTHGLGHLVVGWSMGIRFTAWFVAAITYPQPGVKIDYATYLRASPRRRAWMHASGAIATKLVPFLLIGAAIAANLPAWAVWLLLGLGVVMVTTDVLWSTSASDWKKYKREMAYARAS